MSIFNNLIFYNFFYIKQNRKVLSIILIKYYIIKN